MADQLSRVFAALADPTRRDMVARLTEADHTVNDLAAPYDVSLQAVSKHLKVLEDAGLVSRTREAQRRPVREARGGVQQEAGEVRPRSSTRAEWGVAHRRGG